MHRIEVPLQMERITACASEAMTIATGFQRFVLQDAGSEIGNFES